MATLQKECINSVDQKCTCCESATFVSTQWKNTSVKLHNLQERENREILSISQIFRSGWKLSKMTITQALHCLEVWMVMQLSQIRQFRLFDSPIQESWAPVFYFLYETGKMFAVEDMAPVCQGAESV